MRIIITGVVGCLWHSRLFLLFLTLPAIKLMVSSPYKREREIKKMYNTKIYCECGWSQKFDDKRSTFHFETYKYCPVCGKELKKCGVSIDL